MTSPTPRGIRNHNPGNIRWGDSWQGLVPESQRTDKSFCQFTAPEYGIRAMVKILLKYQSKYHLETIADIINRWAPPSENQTHIYATHVADQLDTTPWAPINLFNNATMRALVKAIIRHENGQQPYSDEVIRKGQELAA